jgi:fibronectin-binding autotransporter adhesin
LNYATTPITGSFDLILGGTSTSDNGISTVLSMSTLTKNGIGSWKISATNTYTGLTTINAGTLKLDSDNTTTLGTAAGGTIVNTGAVLDLKGKKLGVAEPLTLNGTGISNGGALINSSVGTPVSYSGAITLASASGIGTTGNITLSSTVLGGFDLTKYGAGTLNMGAATDSLGSLTISAGTYTASSTNTKLRGNFTNNATFTHNSGTVLFMGTSAQTLSGTTAATSFSNLTLNNSTGVTLSTVDPTINGTLTLTSGNITTGSDTVIIAANGSLTRTTGAGEYIVGNLKKFISTSTMSKLFEIGDATNYTPVTLSLIHI